MNSNKYNHDSQDLFKFLGVNQKASDFDYNKMIKKNKKDKKEQIKFKSFNTRII